MMLLERPLALDRHVRRPWHVALVWRIGLDGDFASARRRGRREVQEVTNLYIGSRRCSRSELYDRVPAQAHGDPPWLQVTRDMNRPPIAIGKDHVDRKTHERGMDGDARRKQQPLGRCHAVAPEEPSPPGRPIGRNFDLERNRRAGAIVHQRVRQGLEDPRDQMPADAPAIRGVGGIATEHALFHQCTRDQRSITNQDDRRIP